MAGETSERPNVLWIQLEDTSPRLGPYGDTVARTPNIDRLAAEGCSFTNAFSPSPVCAPSRSATHLGMYQTAVGTHHHRTSEDGSRAKKSMVLPGPYEAVPPHYAKLLPEYLRHEEYFCTLEGSTDFQHATPLTAFDECDPSHLPWYDDPPDWTVRDADPFHRGADQPFFAVVNPAMTHESGMWPDEDESLDTEPASVTVPPYLPDTERTRRTLARHYDNIAAADAAVGEILDRLEAQGVADNTAVFLFSDHGEGMPRSKRWLYDSGIHVPMIVRWPGETEPGSTDDRLVSLVDMAPTVLSIAGIEPPTHMHGRPFLGTDAEPRQYVFAARDRHDELYDTVRAVRTQRFKYVRNYHPEQPYVGWNIYRNRHPVMEEMYRLDATDSLSDAAADWFADSRPPEELYDVRSDPHETENLAGDPAYEPVLEELHGALDEWQDETGDQGVVPEVETVANQWPNGDQPTTGAPHFVVNAPDRRGDEVVDSVTVDSPASLSLASSTQGASLAYRTGDDDHWQLYTGPIDLELGTTMVRARAIRYGYAKSDEARLDLRVTDEGSADDERHS